MKMYKSIIIVLVLIVLSFSLAACNNSTDIRSEFEKNILYKVNESDLIGKWEGVLKGTTFIFEFKADKNFIMEAVIPNDENEIAKGNYELGDNMLTLIYDDETFADDKAVVAMQNGKLIMTIDTDRIELTRK